MLGREPLVLLNASTMYGVRKGAKLSHRTDALHVQRELGVIQKGKQTGARAPGPRLRRPPGRPPLGSGKPPRRPADAARRARVRGRGWRAGPRLRGTRARPGLRRTPASWLNDFARARGAPPPPRDPRLRPLAARLCVNRAAFVEPFGGSRAHIFGDSIAMITEALGLFPRILHYTGHANLETRMGSRERRLGARLQSQWQRSLVGRLGVSAALRLPSRAAATCGLGPNRSRFESRPRRAFARTCRAH